MADSDRMRFVSILIPTYILSYVVSYNISWRKQRWLEVCKKIAQDCNPANATVTKKVRVNTHPTATNCRELWKRRFMPTTSPAFESACYL